jgi:hypothetical protein
VSSCEADICMAGCYGDYDFYVPEKAMARVGTPVMRWFLEGVGTGATRIALVNPDFAAMRIRRLVGGGYARWEPER